MCGIVGYVGPRDCSDVLVSALTKLEYRGYDSAGIAVFENGRNRPHTLGYTRRTVRRKLTPSLGQASYNRPQRHY